MNLLVVLVKKRQEILLSYSIKHALKIMVRNHDDLCKQCLQAYKNGRYAGIHED